jgi:hypothetical protein
LLFIKKDITLIPKLKTTPPKVGVQRTPAPRWIPPSDGLAKANVDGVVSVADSLGAAAVVFHSMDGTYIGSSVIVFPRIPDPPSLEALACREALALAEDLSLVASDCRQVIDDISEDTGGQYASIVKEISIHKLAFNNVIFTFERRESNKDAHSLARFALGLAPGRHVWLLEPFDTSRIPVTLSFDQ